MNTRHKIIFDTDPGIDDAMAILFAEAHPDIELMGLTTVYGNAPIETTTKNALFLKQKFGMDATIAKGADKPLVRSPYHQVPSYTLKTDWGTTRFRRTWKVRSMLARRGNILSTRCVHIPEK